MKSKAMVKARSPWGSVGVVSPRAVTASEMPQL